jgi:hypothetical protein
MSYSQNNEESILLEFFAGKTDGTFLEIGAFHPTRFSNTKALIERGWSGFMVEMSPYALVDLCEAYKDNPKIRIISAAVTIESEPITAYLVPKDDVVDGAISTTEEWHRDRWAASLASQGRKHMPFIAATISMIELMSLLPPKVDLVSIDTEGTSVRLANAFDFDRFGVRAAVIEHDNAHTISMPDSFRNISMNAENVIFVR